MFLVGLIACLHYYKTVSGWFTLELDLWIFAVSQSVHNIKYACVLSCELIKK